MRTDLTPHALWRIYPRGARTIEASMSAALDGSTALVTGGGRGLGRGIAQHLALAGARVALVARTRSQLEEAAAAIGAEGGSALPIVADVHVGRGGRAAVAE